MRVLTAELTAALLAALGLVTLASSSAALTIDNGVVVFNSADVAAGNITPGDTPGFPATISAPGAYRLSSGLTVTTSVNAVEISGAEVTFDLGGFRIIGSGVGYYGIWATGRAPTIQNGTIRAFINAAVRSTGNHTSIDRIRATDSVNMGIHFAAAAGSRATITNSQVIDSTTTGIYCNSHCLIQNVQSAGNSYGIRFLDGGSVLDSQIASNTTGILAAGQVAMGDTHLYLNGTNITGTVVALSPNRCDALPC